MSEARPMFQQGLRLWAVNTPSNTQLCWASYARHLILRFYVRRDSNNQIVSVSTVTVKDAASEPRAGERWGLEEHFDNVSATNALVSSTAHVCPADLL